MLDLNPHEYAALLRQDFYSFIERCFCHLNPTAEFLPADYIEVLAAKLESARRGETRRLIINVPPRYLKSTSTSIALPAFWLGHDPSAQILCASYGQEFANKLSADTRSILQSDWYRHLFPTRLSPHRQAVNEFATTQGGFRLATSVGGPLTGRGSDVIIIDDPLKPDEAISDVQRQGANQWFDHSVFSRLNNKERGVIIIVMHRLHEEDLVGHVCAKEAWEILSFPAIAEQDEVHCFETMLGRRRVIRNVGELLHPERESLATLETIRRTIGEYNFAGQYQQSPSPLGGGLVKPEWFGTFDPEALPDRFDQVVQSWDTANKATELNDFSVCTTWGIKGGRFYLLHVFRHRLNYPDLKRAVRQQWEFHHPSVILIEDKASGTQLIQELIRDGISCIKACQPKGDKIMRMHAQTALIENGFALLPRQAPWRDVYLHELATFPKGSHDDQVDSTAQALEWIQQATQEPGIIAYYRRCVEKAAEGS